MIFACRLPPGKTQLRWGQIKIAVAVDGYVDVPEYLARSLITLGCTCNDPINKTSPLAELIAHGQQWETSWLMHAAGEHYSQLPKGYDKRLHAIALLNRGLPAPAIS